ncbi:MAG: D-amino acid dehydrogenase, partial [Burkholderiales bacterium]|nr:D-amino acid dehydrogenase [Burkholderiales bacterium]
MKVIVLGAGVVGTASAWFLAKQGHEVTVIDRQPAAGLETSFANGGQLSVSHAEPWANPSAPLKVLKWLAKEDAPLLFRLRADLDQWRWCLGFLRECTPARTRHNIAQIVRLGLYSREMLGEVLAETGIAFDHGRRGILHFYTSRREFDAAQAPAQVMRGLGCELDMKTPDECVAIEPALALARGLIVGGSMTPSDGSGDAHLFTRNLAAACAARGVTFLYGTAVERIVVERGTFAGVEVRRAGAFRMERGDACVLSLGSFSANMAKPLGLRLPVYPAKGYSLTMPVADPARAYHVSLTDDEYKLVFSRLGNRLRVAGTCELNGYDTALNAVRCAALLRRTEELFPGAGDASRAEYWTGLRPATPSNVPCIGRTRVP